MVDWRVADVPCCEGELEAGAVGQADVTVLTVTHQIRHVHVRKLTP